MFSLHTQTHTHDDTTQASPVHVRRPAAGGVLCPPPSRWGRTDRRLSCSLSPGSHRCRWAGTLPALVPAWDRGFTEGHWHYGGGWRIGLSATEMAAVPPAMEPVLLLKQTLEQLELLATALRFHTGWWHNRGGGFCFDAWFLSAVQNFHGVKSNCFLLFFLKSAFCWGWISIMLKIPFKQISKLTKLTCGTAEKIKTSNKMHCLIV